MTTPTNIVSAAAINAATKMFNAIGTLDERRNAMGKVLVADGFIIDTDFAAKSAKDAGRPERYDAIKYLAQGAFPAPVTKALRDNTIAGDTIVKANAKDASKTTKTQWSQRVPGKIRDILNAYKIFLDADKKTGAKPATRDINTRVLDEIAKLKSAVEKDATADVPAATFDKKEMLAAFTRITEIVKKAKVDQEPSH